jgi:predicted alpha/beta superfamily hydrolase
METDSNLGSKPRRLWRFGLIFLLLIALAFVLKMQFFKSAPAIKPSPSAQANVSVLTEKFVIPGLQRERQIRLYLPPDYATSDKRYPVLYMHDGQNLFDAATAYAGEWGVDEIMNALARAGRLELIVVGIDNGGEKRMTELNPWTHADFGQAEGQAYMDFIVKVVKPRIDEQYRTKPDRLNTAIMGSSMGGLISHYAIAQYPDVFSKAGIFSPAYWVSGPGFDYFAKVKMPPDARLYFLMGGDEGGSQVPDVKKVFETVRANGHPAQAMSLKITPSGQHNEAFWRGEFEQAIMWMFAEPSSAN